LVWDLTSELSEDTTELCVEDFIILGLTGGLLTSTLFARKNGLKNVFGVGWGRDIKEERS
jgi:hypothetical protein